MGNFIGLDRKLMGLGLAVVMWDIIEQEHICRFGTEVYRVPVYPNAPGVVEALYVKRWNDGNRDLPVAEIEDVRRLAGFGLAQRVH